MKKIFTIIVAITITSSVIAQAPEKMSYQAVVRNSSNQLLQTQTVGMQISILQGSPSGTAVYVETQTSTTNINGLVSLEIGTGNVIIGDFTTINWGSDTYFIKTETDPTGGTSYTITGTSQLMSVPYALHAKTAETITGTVNYTETDPLYTAWNKSTGISITESQISNLTHTVDTDTQLDSTDIANLGFVAGMHTVDTDTQLDSVSIANLGFNAGGITTEVDGSITNEIQTISRTGTTVTLNNGGGSFTDSVNTYTAGTNITISNNVISATGSSSPTYSIGDFVYGGIVFFVDATGQHGLVCAFTDQGILRWYGGTNGDTRALGDGLFAGEMSTSIIIAAQAAIGDDGFTYAARSCNEYQISIGGHTYGDWYLPSKYELNLMYQNKAAIDARATTTSVGGSAGTAFTSSWYWSSTEITSSQVWMQYFVNGTQQNHNKSITHTIRAIRKF